MGKVNVGRLLERMGPALARSRHEKECARLRELEEKRKQEEEKRLAEYNKPLHDFPPRIARETRVRLLTYVSKIFNDAARVVLDKYLQDMLHNPYGYDSWIGGYDLEDAREFANFEDRSVQEFSVAIRVAELKPMPRTSRVDRIGVLYIRHEGPSDYKLLYLARHEGLRKRVCYRLENNLMKNLPILEPILGKSFEARVFDPSFDELRKSGYKADPQEQKVIHLEIF